MTNNQINPIIDTTLVDELISASNIKDVGTVSIRELKKLIDKIEQKSETEFIRMEMGLPGLPAPKIGIEAEIKALRKGVASSYPEVSGLPELKKETSRFVKLFLDIDVDAQGCIPTTGSMQGNFAAFATINRRDKNREGTLFIDPGFPVHRQQLKVLGQGWDNFDIYNYRGKKLRAKLESYLKTGKFCSLLYSNPNNPSWICLTEEELQIIGELATKYDVIVLEDMAYFGMDFRQDYSKPGKSPFQPTVAKYTDKYIIFISGSKTFCYAGQRLGMMILSNKLFNMNAPDLLRYYKTENIGNAIVYGSIYFLSAGASHSAQYGLSAILKASNDGTYDFMKPIRTYGERSATIKKLFIDNGFHILYDKDGEEEIADGFYFTFYYPGFTGKQLIRKLLYYGISCITLAETGSEKNEGMRASISFVKAEQFTILENRLKQFRADHVI